MFKKEVNIFRTAELSTPSTPSSLSLFLSSLTIFHAHIERICVEVEIIIITAVAESGLMQRIKERSQGVAATAFDLCIPTLKFRGQQEVLNSVFAISLT